MQSTDNGTGIYVRWMDSAVLTGLVANLRHSPSDLTWSPDGRWLAFTMSDAVSVGTDRAAPRKKPDGAEWSEPVKVIDRARYRWDGRGFLEPAYTHIFVVPADGGTPRQVTSGDFNHEGPLSWTPDGDASSSRPTANDGWELQSGESDIFSISFTDGELTQNHGSAGRRGESGPSRRTVGSIAYVANANEMLPYNTDVLHVMAIDGSDDRALTPDLDRSVGSISWAGDRQLYFRYNDRAVIKVASVDLDGDMDSGR